MAAEDLGTGARLAFAEGQPATGRAVIVADGNRSTLRAGHRRAAAPLPRAA